MATLRPKVTKHSDQSDEEVDDSLLNIDCKEGEEAEPLLPKNWKETILRIETNPSSFESLMVVDGPKKLNGIYNCVGAKNNRPFYKKTDGDFVIWYDPVEIIWLITDLQGLTLQDPDMYCYVESMLWDITKIPNSLKWRFADAKGNWIKREDMKIKKFSSSIALGNTVTTPVPASALAALAAVKQPVCLASSLWKDLSKLKADVKENRYNINEIEKKQAGIIQIQRDILGRLETLENDKKQKKQADLVRKLALVEKQVEVLERSSVRAKSKLVRGNKSRTDTRSVEDLYRDNCLEKASVREMRAYLTKKKRQKILIDGKRIVLYGKKRDLQDQIVKVITKSRERAPSKSMIINKVQKIDNLARIKQLQAERDLRAAARQKRKEKQERVGNIRKRVLSPTSDRIIKKLRKRTILA